MYVCLCKALTEGDIQSLVEQLGPDLQGIQECCGLATDCGSCRPRAERLIEVAAAGLAGKAAAES